MRRSSDSVPLAGCRSRPGGDLQGKGVVTLANQGGGGGGELLLPAPGQQVKCGCVLGRGRGLQPPPVWLPVSGALGNSRSVKWSRITRYGTTARG